MGDDHPQGPRRWLVIAAIALFILLLWFAVRLWRAHRDAAPRERPPGVAVVVGEPFG